MKILIKIELIINLILLVYFYMHMYQLNSYFLKRYANWIKINYKKVLIKILIVLFSLLLLIFNNFILKVLASIFLVISIVCNLPLKKAKIPLKLTNRVKRMIFTIVIIIVSLYILKSEIITLGILNIIACLLCVISNIINYPLEYSIRKYYINDAKKILKNMPRLTVIGITGSYGKTSIKNFLVKLLSAQYEVIATPENYNTTMGVVKTIRKELKPIHQIFVCEMGATKCGDIKEICDIVNPKIGIITAIGPQHMQNFRTIENVIKTKFELYDAVLKNDGVTFLNFDNNFISKQQKENIITYGVNNEKLDYNAVDLKSSSQGLSFKVKDIEFKTKLIGRHNIVNLTGAIAVANHLNISLERLISRVREIKNVEHRLSLIQKGDLNIIDDSYNSNPVSSKMAINTLLEFESIRIIVTPGLIDLGEKEEKYNYEFGEYMCNGCDYIFIVNSSVSKFVLNGIKSKQFDNNKLFKVKSPQEAIQKISEMNLGKKVTVLLENDLPDNYN